MVLDFEFEKLKKEINKIKPKKVLIQLPEGIKKHAFEINEFIKKIDSEIKLIFSGETAWGGCSLDILEAKRIKADLIIHFGHSKFINTNFPAIYIEIKDKLDLKYLLNKSLEVLKNYKKIGLSYSIQHKHDIKKIKEFYKKNNIEIILSDKGGLTSEKGQVIGCEFSGLKKIQNKVEAFLIIGNKFHSMGAAISIKKPVFLLDVYNNKVESMDSIKDKIIRQRAISIEKLKNAKKVGVIIESKIGQKFGNSEHISKKLKEKDKDAIIITMNEITQEKLMNFYNVDVFIELACPRIAIDDFHKYKKPILTYKEALVALGEKSWEELQHTGFL